MDSVAVIWLSVLEITLLPMKLFALVNQLLHGQQPSLTGMLQRQPDCVLGHDIYINVQEASMWKFRNTKIWY
jgi:hypothetical protein